MRRAQGRVGLAVVGCGSIGGLRAVVAAGHPAVDFLALYDVDPTRSRALADQTGADLCAESLDEVLARPEVDAVIVSSTEEAHRAPVLAGLRSGRPVLVEKPIAHDLSEAKDLVQASAAAGDRLWVGYTQRFRRKYLNGKEQILRGHLGDLSGMSAKFYTTRASGPEDRGPLPPRERGDRPPHLHGRPDAVVLRGAPPGERLRPLVHRLLRPGPRRDRQHLGRAPDGQRGGRRPRHELAAPRPPPGEQLHPRHRRDRRRGLPHHRRRPHGLRPHLGPRAGRCRTPASPCTRPSSAPTRRPTGR